MGTFLRVREYKVDADALLRLGHRCDPSLCGESGSCCAAHDAWIGPEEYSRIARILPAAQKYIEPPLRDSEVDGFIRQLGDQLYTIYRRPSGLCVFAYRADGDRVLCALHSAALSKGETPERAKPRGCALWPLSVSTSDRPELSVQAGAYRFPCNTKRSGKPAALHPGTAELVRVNFGEEFLRELADALR